MRTLILAAAAMMASAPATAAIVDIHMTGTILTTYVDELFTETLESPLSVGDPITAHLSFDEAYYAISGDQKWFDMFRYGTMEVAAGPFTWGNDFLDGTPVAECYPVREGCGIAYPLAVFENGTFKGFFTTADNQSIPDSPDLTVDGFAFRLSEVGYDLYTGPAFTGRFDPNSVRITVTGPVVGGFVPEPAAWFMMVAGFGILGAALRSGLGSSRYRGSRVKALAGA